MSAQELAVNVPSSLAEVSAGDIMMNVPLLQQIDHMAARMANSKATIPDHLRNNEGDCWAIIMQAIQWGMNPYVVAQKTHLVNGKLGYEAQLVNAVVQNSGMIVGPFRYEYRGEGADLECRVGAKIKGDSETTWNEWLAVKDVKVQNSPLWKTNPKQQIGYLQLKNWTRANTPGAILGIYTPDELETMPVTEREVGPSARVSDLNAQLKAEAGDKIEEAEVVEDAPEAEQEAEHETVTYAMVAKGFNDAGDLEALDRAKDFAADFLTVGENAKYRDELLDVYKARKSQLMAAQTAEEFGE